MMVDTELVLEQMRAANPAPSLEQLALDDLNQVRDIVARGKSAMPMKEQAQTRPDRLTTRRRLRPVLVAGLAFILVLATLGSAVLLYRGYNDPATAEFTCPPGSTPDQPGPADQPRPRFVLHDSRATFDPASGRALMLNEPGLFWIFDVCTNTWTAAPRPGKIGFNTWTAAPRPGEIGFVTDFVYDVDSARAIAFAIEDKEVAQVWAYEPDGQGWTRKNNLTVGPARYGDEPVNPLFQAVYDPVTGLVVVRATLTSQMWTYDVDTDTWTEIDQGAILPPALEDAQLLTYDASVDRLILPAIYFGDSRPSSTWEFDIRAGRWEEHTTNTPEIQGFGWGWWPSADDEFIYDEANQVSVIYGSDPPAMATYDAREHTWTVLHSGEIPGLVHGFPGGAPTYDSVNKRILFIGSRSGGEMDGVAAFDVANREWIILLEPTAE